MGRSEPTEAASHLGDSRALELRPDAECAKQTTQSGTRIRTSALSSGRRRLNPRSYGTGPEVT